MATKNIALALITSFFCLKSYAVDSVTLAVPSLKTSQYRIELISEALRQTEPSFGAFSFNAIELSLSNERFHKELNVGKLFNARVALTYTERESETHAIRIPLRKGLINFRVLLVNKSNLSKFANISTIEGVKKLKAGMIYHWLTQKVLEHHQFEFMKIPSYEALFNMLIGNRYDYTLRGIHEVYSELDALDTESQLAVLPGIALYINSPSYIFISKNEPRLAKRIEQGLEQMIKNGRFEEIFQKFFKKSIAQANLANRKILFLDNPFLPENTPLERDELWYNAELLRN